MEKTPIPVIKEFGDTAPRKNPAAMTAYRCSLYGLIPLAAVVLGPAAVIWGTIALHRWREDHKRGGGGQARVAIMVGGASFVSNVAGIYCIAHGLGWL